MMLLDLVRERRAEVAACWVDLTLATYPASGAALFLNERDPFKNPVGGIVRRSLAVLLDALLGDAAGVREVDDALDAVVRMRAVQDFTPGRAVGFVFLVRTAVREVLGEPYGACPAEEHEELSARIETLAMSAFDAFASCRQRLFELRTAEAKARVHSLLKRAGAVEEDVPEAGAGGAAATKGGCAV
jgi:hypothetical protein